MRLTDCEIEKLLPLFMRAELDNIAIAKTLDEVIRYIGENITLCSDWGVIDFLPEDFLDALAWELDIEWYDKSADIDVKRSLIKSSDKVHAHNGTKAAVLKVVEDYYGGGIIEEWFEYGGDPGHFKISVTSEDMHITVPEEFIALVNKIKRKSAILDGMDFTWTNYQKIYAGCAEYKSYHNADLICHAD